MFERGGGDEGRRSDMGRRGFSLGRPPRNHVYLVDFQMPLSLYRLEESTGVYSTGPFTEYVH